MARTTQIESVPVILANWVDELQELNEVSARLKVMIEIAVNNELGHSSADVVFFRVPFGPIPIAR